MRSMTNAKRVTAHRRKRKQKCVDYKGGKCERCGYSKCLRALEFHHLDRKDKNPDTRTAKDGLDMCKSWKKLVKELDKCQLLCANCHREVEEEFITAT